LVDEHFHDAEILVQVVSKITTTNSHGASETASITTENLIWLLKLSLYKRLNIPEGNNVNTARPNPKRSMENEVPRT